MKKAALLASILALALGASAQNISFAGLPAVSNPTLLPNNYSNLNWSGFYYVDPLWSGAGDGFKQGPNSLDVAYMGGGECEKAGVSCSASIASNGSAANALAGFKAQSAIVAAGYHSEIVNVSAYNNGHFVGSQNYSLSTSLQQINFPAGWGMITQLVMDTNSGTLVLYSLSMQNVGASALGATSNGAGASALDDTVSPTAPVHVLDPPKGGNGGSAVIGPGPVAGSSETTIADADVLKPPIIVITPSAPKQPQPVAHESNNTIADARTVLKPPIVIGGPTAPKKPQPVAHESDNTIADADILKPPIIVITPSAPKKPVPVAHELEGASV